MQPVLERGSIDKPLTFDVGLIQLSFIPVCSPNTCVKLHRGFALYFYGKGCPDKRGVLINFYGKGCPDKRGVLISTVRGVLIREVSLFLW